MSTTGLSSDVSGAAAYSTAGATANSAQAQDVSACLITLPLTLLVDTQDVEIYGKVITSSLPLVDCSGMLPRVALYNADPALTAITFQQDPADATKVVAAIPATFDQATTGVFATSFNTVLNTKPVKLSSLDAAAFVWWNETGKSIATDPNFANPNSVLYKYANFPKFVLAKIAYDVFGHPLAQAGIANDTAITGDLEGATDPNTSIGTRLAAAFKNMTAPQLQAVYEQMLAQDPARFNLEDVSGGALGSDGSSAQAMPRSLPFKVGDTIRFEIVLNDYNVKRVALNAVTGNDVTTESAATLSSAISSALPEASGSVLSTKYAGLRVTVQTKIGS